MPPLHLGCITRYGAFPDESEHFKLSLLVLNNVNDDRFTVNTCTAHLQRWPQPINEERKAHFMAYM